MRSASERATGPYALAERRRWLIQLGPAELRLLDGDADVTELLQRGRVSGATAVYEVTAGPRALGDIPELACLLAAPAPAEPLLRADQRSRERATLSAVTTEPPPVRLDRRSPERAQLSEELAILDRPLEDDVEYYDEVPAARWPRRTAILVLIVLAAFGSYRVAARRLPPIGAWRLPSFLQREAGASPSAALPAKDAQSAGAVPTSPQHAPVATPGATRVATKVATKESEDDPPSSLPVVEIQEPEPASVAAARPAHVRHKHVRSSASNRRGRK